MSNFYSHVRSDRAKWVIVTIVLIVLLTLTIFLTVKYFEANPIVKKVDKPVEEVVPPVASLPCLTYELVSIPLL